MSGSNVSPPHNDLDAWRERAPSRLPERAPGSPLAGSIIRPSTFHGLVIHWRVRSRFARRSVSPMSLSLLAGGCMFIM